MLELARSFEGAPVVMADLAEREGVSRKYLHALLTGLREAGLARSVRGAGGGFALARDPSEIKLKEVLHALEGPLCLVDCVADARACDRAEGCSARGVWRRLSGVVSDTLDSITLADVIATERRRGSGERRASAKPCGRGSDLRRQRVRKAESGRRVLRRRP